MVEESQLSRNQLETKDKYTGFRAVYIRRGVSHDDEGGESYGTSMEWRRNA